MFISINLIIFILILRLYLVELLNIYISFDCIFSLGTAFFSCSSACDTHTIQITPIKSMVRFPDHHDRIDLYYGQFIVVSPTANFCVRPDLHFWFSIRNRRYKFFLRIKPFLHSLKSCLNRIK